jgi:exodeoxyribonuclease V alpha subunit
MYLAAKVLGQIFANPPFYILRCVVASENESEVIVVKGNIPGPVNRNFVFTFQGKRKKDKNNKDIYEVVRSPINPKFLKGTSLTNWSNWVSPDMRESTQLISDLVASGVPVKTINELWKDIRNNPDMIKENPWLLVHKGVSFKEVDSIARSLLGDEFDLKNPNRVSACVYWSLVQGYLNGHCYLDANTVFRDISILTLIQDPKEIGKAIKSMSESSPPQLMVEKLEDGKRAIYLPPYYQMERDVADMVKSPLREASPLKLTPDEIRSYTRYELTDTQLGAIQQGLTEPFSIVTGLPGTGKTTILSTLCKILQEAREEVLLIAPTGIAAKRAKSLTGMEALTIHRAFGAGQPAEEKEQKSDYEGVKKEEGEGEQRASTTDPRRSIWKHGPNNERHETVVIIDESSMVDLHLMWRVLRGISPKCRVIMVGDIAQLPPVGAGFVLSELIESNVVPRTHLTDIFRQGEGSGVTIAAHEIHNGKVPESNTEFVILERDSDRETLDTITTMCRDFFLDEVDFHVMSPTHHGEVGVTNLNRTLRSALNPDIGGACIKIGKDTLREGDRVMITKNDYDLEVFNGDIGRICHIDKSHVEVSIKGVRDELVAIPRDKIGRVLRLAYATTVHKSQGLEYEVILMPLSSACNSNLLQRSLLYTAVTRAKTKVFLIGDVGALATCVLNNRQDRGFASLKNRLARLK